jgi:hypothetical protein
MKTIFTRDEITQFISKLNSELQGENILFNMEEKPTNVHSFMDAFTHIHSLGFKEGRMSEKLEIIDKLFKFFEIQ